MSRDVYVLIYGRPIVVMEVESKHVMGFANMNFHSEKLNEICRNVKVDTSV